MSVLKIIGTDDAVVLGDGRRQQKTQLKQGRVRVARHSA